MKFDEVAERLSYYNGEIPKKEIEYALKNENKITPKLFEYLDYTIEHLDDIMEYLEPDYYGYVNAIFILAELKNKDLFPYIIKFINLGDEILEHIIGDDYPEYLPRILASSYNEDDESLFEIIENQQIEGYIRSSVLATFSILYLEGVKTREFLIDYFKKLIKRIDGENEEFCDLILNEIIDLKLIELADDVKTVYDHLGESELKNDFEKLLKLKDTTLNRYIYPLYQNYEYIHDIVDIMEGWQCFLYRDDAEFEMSEIYNYVMNLILKRNKNKIKIGRNDSCYCGSGKKYKNCCIDKEQNSDFDMIDKELARAIWYEERKEDKKALTYYRYAFYSTINYCDKKNITSLSVIDHEWDSINFFTNWIQDYFLLLANQKDMHTLYERLEIYNIFEKTFDLNQEDPYWNEMIIREKANATFQIGNEEVAIKIIEDYLKTNPLWIWGYIEMADWYLFYKNTTEDYKKAIDILNRTFSVGIKEDIDVVYERLEDLYQKIGDKEKLKYIKQQRKLVESI